MLSPRGSTLQVSRRGVRHVIACVVSIVAAITLVVSGASTAAADTGGYPYSSYYGPGSNPSGSWWTDATGNGWSQNGYAYRNCTDYVAWKLKSLGVDDSRVRGLGNGRDWANNARLKGLHVSSTPAAASVAVDTSGQWGHVGFVESVGPNGAITVSEYNWPVGEVFDGSYHVRTGTLESLGFTEFIHFNTIATGGISDGSFIAINGQSTVYRIVGGAPIRLTNWGAIPGCCGNVMRVSQSKFDSLRAYPRDGAIISIHEANGQGIYRFIGGAPIRLYNWGVVDGCCGSAVTINFGSLQALDHMRAYPYDGAMMSIAEANGDGIYTFAGGAPLRLYDWGIIPGSGTAKEVNFKSLQQLDHMVPLPKNGTFIAAKENGVVYRIAGGAPLRLYDQGSVPGFAGTVVWVNQKTIDQHDHMNVNPSNGTVLKGVPSGQFWVITDGKRSLATSQSNAIVVNDQTVQDFPLQ